MHKIIIKCFFIGLLIFLSSHFERSENIGHLEDFLEKFYDIDYEPDSIKNLSRVRICNPYLSLWLKLAGKF